MKISNYFLYSFVLFPILLFHILYSMSDKKLISKEHFSRNSHKIQSKWSIENYLRQGVLAGSVWNLFKNREIIHTHGETRRIEPKWGDLPIRWRKKADLWNSSMQCFQPQLKIIYCYKNGVCHFIVVVIVIWSIYFILTFSYAILTSWVEIIFFGV